ncbi:MAG: phosphatidylserine decarboxylase [Gammaproteobacteria bacterium]
MNRYTVIAREGHAPLLAALVVAFMVWHFVSMPASLLFWALVVLVVFVFRDPERDIPSIPLAVVSPADGKIASIDTIIDPYLQRQSIRVSVLMNVYGVFTTRSPVEGKVQEPPHRPTGVNTPHGVWLKTNEDDDVVMVMNRGRMNAGPRCYIRFGERIGQGKRCGFIPLGSRIDLYLPENSRLAVAVGDSVLGGADVIAYLVHA